MLRSIDHIDPSYVRFENKTKRNIDVVWLDYNGVMVKYGTLCPEQYLDVDTFKTHPWIFIDRLSGEKMVVRSKTVFFPVSMREIQERLRITGNFRIPILIQLPLFSLRQTCLHVLLSCLRDINDVENLGLPTNITEDLKKLNQDKESILAQVSFRFHPGLPFSMFLFW